MTSEASSKLLQKIADDLSRGDPVFPTCFNITIKVRDLLRDPELSIEKLSKTLQAEPIISSKLLKMANSAALGPAAGGNISDLKGAVMRLGLEAVKSVSFSVAMEQLAHSKHMSAHMKLSYKIWEHSVLVAVIARQLSKRFKRAKPDEAFFAGLVHDIGAFYLLYYAAQQPEFANDPDGLLALMIDWHDGIGHALLDALGQQSEDLLAAVQDHESTAPMTGLVSLSDVLRCANIIANTEVAWRDDRAPVNPIEGIFDEATLAEIVEDSKRDLAELRSTLTI